MDGRCKLAAHLPDRLTDPNDVAYCLSIAHARDNSSVTAAEEVAEHIDRPRPGRTDFAAFVSVFSVPAQGEVAGKKLSVPLYSTIVQYRRQVPHCLCYVCNDTNCIAGCDVA